MAAEQVCTLLSLAGDSPSLGVKCSLAFPEVMGGLRIPQVKSSYLFFQEMPFLAFLRT